MKITSKINEKDGLAASTYPYLGIASDKKAIRIVLFSKKGSGFIIHDSSGYYKIGYYCESWAEQNDFTIFNGEVTLALG